MSEYIAKDDVKRRAGVFALWLAYEAKSNPELEAVRQVFLSVEADIASGRMVQAEQASYLYGVIEGHARAWAYLEDYQAEEKLYLTEYLWAVRDGENN